MKASCNSWLRNQTWMETPELQSMVTKNIGMFIINKTKGLPPLVESGTVEDFFNKGVHSDADTPCLLNDTESNEHFVNSTLETKAFNILLLKFE